MKNKRQSTIDALNKFYQRQIDEAEGKKPVPKRKNEKPEKEVERACLAWMREQGWTVNVYEAKAKWNSEAERFTSTGMRFGTCDCMGNTDQGVAVAVEFKAPGCLSSFNREERFLQKKFIVDRINTNAFACVVDSVDRLKTIYLKFMELRSDPGAARNYLLSALPQQTEKTRLKNERLFPDDDEG